MDYKNCRASGSSIYVREYDVRTASRRVNPILLVFSSVQMNSFIDSDLQVEYTNYRLENAN